MDNQDFQKQLDEQQKALAMIYKSVEKTRKYIMWSGIISLAMFVIPAIIMIFALPKIIGIFTNSLGTTQTEQNIPIESLSDTLNNLKNLGF